MLMFSKIFNLDLAVNKAFRVFFVLTTNILLLGEVKYGPAILRKVLTIMQRKSKEELIITSNDATNFMSKLIKLKNNKIILIYLIKSVCLFITVIVIFGVNRYGTLINGDFDITYLLFILIVILLVPSSWACYNDEIDSFRRRQSYFFTIDKLLSENPKFEKAKLETFPEK